MFTCQTNIQNSSVFLTKVYNKPLTINSKEKLIVRTSHNKEQFLFVYMNVKRVCKTGFSVLFSQVIKYPSIRYPVSGIRYPLSAIHYPVSTIWYPRFLPCHSKMLQRLRRTTAVSCINHHKHNDHLVVLLLTY